MNTQENNKLIAEFMGAEKTHRHIEGDIYCPVPSKNGSEYADKLQYHKSWDWLMPVVDKCYTSNIQHPNDDITQGLIDVDIKSTYKAVVEFINEYNKNK